MIKCLELFLHKTVSSLLLFIIFLSWPALLKHQMHWDSYTYLNHYGMKVLSATEVSQHFDIFEKRLTVAKNLNRMDALKFSWEDQKYWGTLNALRNLYYRYSGIVVGSLLLDGARFLDASPSIRLMAVQVFLILFSGGAIAAFISIFLIRSTSSGAAGKLPFLIGMALISCPPLLSLLRQPLTESIALLVMFFSWWLWTRCLIAARAKAYVAPVFAVLVGVIMFLVLRVRYDGILFTGLGLLAIWAVDQQRIRIDELVRLLVFAALGFLLSFVFDGLVNGWGQLPWRYAGTALADMGIGRYDPENRYIVDALLLNLPVLTIGALLALIVKDKWGRAVALVAAVLTGSLITSMWATSAQWEARHIFSIAISFVFVVMLLKPKLPESRYLKFSVAVVASAILGLNILSALIFQTNSEVRNCYWCWTFKEVENGIDVRREIFSGYHMWTDRQGVLLPDNVADDAWVQSGRGRKKIYVESDVAQKYVLLPIRYAADTSYDVIDPGAGCSHVPEFPVVALIEGSARLLKPDDCRANSSVRRKKQ